MDGTELARKNISVSLPDERSQRLLTNEGTV